MFILCVVASILLALVAFGSGMGKFQGVPQVKQLLESVGAEKLRRPIGFLELAGALGLIVGLFIAPIGIAAAAGMTLYFIGAIGAHLRVGDSLKQALMPAPLLVLSIVTLVLRIVTA